MQSRHLIHHCRRCGHAVEQRVPDDGDTRVRAICPACHLVHYLNPLNVVGTIPVWEDKVLLCKRNIEPRMGKWTLPAGFMELDETTAEGAARETWEEAGIHVDMGPLFSIISVPRVGQVHLFYRAAMRSPEFAPGPETQQARLYAEADIPWGELAFQTTQRTLECFFADRRAGAFGLHDLRID
ncbi:NUDIX hydrolase [Comamonadaceae bacterium OH3737_COT-264]|nr:NUDIX hydrolase [Comamonadaceae bacterium OH3737_COT-264]